MGGISKSYDGYRYLLTVIHIFKSYRINHYSTFSTLKASVVERFNRTLKELMWREFSFNGKYK